MPYLTQRTYTTSDGSRVVPEDSAEAGRLLGNEGTEVTAEQVKALNLKTSDTWPPEVAKAPEKKGKSAELGAEG